MARKKKAGRPKMAPERRKIKFSVTLNPDLVHRIDAKVSPQKRRNELIEETLQEKF